MTLDEHKAALAEQLALALAGIPMPRKPASIVGQLRAYIRVHALPLIVVVTDGVITIEDA